ncbi:MAG: allantoinase [Acidobacteria bacterium]|nr:MAG: allantoinase [Acidobacteriota bacterium]
MAKLALVYGVRMLPSDELESVSDAAVALKNGRKVSVTMHLIEGSSEQEIRMQLLESLDAFFEFYPEI